MRRPDKTGGKAVKPQRRRKTLKRRDTLKAVRRRTSTSAGRETNVARLSRELSEAFEQQAVTADILNIISNSPTDTQPVFDAIVQRGLKLFPDALIILALRYGDMINAAAIAERYPERAEAWRRAALWRIHLTDLEGRERPDVGKIRDVRLAVRVIMLLVDRDRRRDGGGVVGEDERNGA